MLDKKDIYRAFHYVTGLEGVWEDQVNAPALANPSFSLRFLHPGRPWEFRSNRTEDQDAVVRLTSTLQLKIKTVDYPEKIIAAVHGNVKFRELLRSGGLVMHDIISSIDVSSAVPEWEKTYIVDMRVSWTEVTTIMPEDEKGEIKHIEATGEIEGKPIVVPPDPEMPQDFTVVSPHGGYYWDSIPVMVEGVDYYNITVYDDKGEMYEEYGPVEGGVYHNIMLPVGNYTIAISAFDHSKVVEIIVVLPPSIQDIFFPDELITGSPFVITGTAENLEGKIVKVFYKDTNSDEWVYLGEAVVIDGEFTIENCILDEKGRYDFKFEVFDEEGSPYGDYSYSDSSMENVKVRGDYSVEEIDFPDHIYEGESFTLEGEITGAEGETIYIYIDGELVEEVRLNEDGTFEVVIDTPLEPGAYEIVIKDDDGHVIVVIVIEVEDTPGPEITGERYE